MQNGRFYDLLNSIFPDSALRNIGTPERPDVSHQGCEMEGNMRNLNSIFPDSALRNIGTPERPDVSHQGCEMEGNMRNLK